MATEANATTEVDLDPAAGQSEWRCVTKRKRDFVGKRSLARPDLVAQGRKQLVGLLTENPAEVLDEGAQIVEEPLSATQALGHVTSSYWSPNVGSSIALALVADGRARQRMSLSVTSPTGFTKARVTLPAFLDPKGARVHG
jgi:sarcosine oxidase, subunit alpha